MAGGDDREGNCSEVDPTVGHALKKGERQRKELSDTLIKLLLIAAFWSKVKISRGWGEFPNLYKLVTIYIVQPRSSIECERGFSAQNRIKSKSRSSRLSVARLELLMRLSLLHKQQGADLTAESSSDFLREASVMFDQELGVGC